MTDTRLNLVGHCQEGTSDKLYMACIKEENGQYLVIGKWGPRGHVNVKMIVKLTTPNLQAAITEQNRLFRSKLKKGYVDIVDASYKGPLTMSSPEVLGNLEYCKADPAPSAAPQPAVVALDAGREFIAECSDNLGMEDKFDSRIEYVAESHVDATLVWVYDKFGEKQEVFKERFKELVKS